MRTPINIFTMLLITVMLSCSSRYEKLRFDLPTDATQIQEVRFTESVGPDQGLLLFFVLPEDKLEDLLSRIQIDNRYVSTADVASPLDLGYPKWAPKCETFVPGNMDISGIKSHWGDSARPVEAISGKSESGDWTHIEIYILEENFLIKLYVDAN